MSTLRTATAPVLAALVVLAACDGGDAATTTPSTTPDTVASTPPTTIPATAPSSTPTATSPEGTMPTDRRVQAAIEDLAAHLGRPVADIAVRRVEDVTWRNGALGCPEPGRSYTQALVPGYRIELVVEGASVWYHGAHDGDPFRCDSPTDPVDGAAGDR